MARGFLSGIIGGTVVGTLGTAALSLLTTLPPGSSGAPEISETDNAIVLQPSDTVSAPQIPSADISEEDIPLIGLSEPGDGGNQDVPVPDKTSADAPDVDVPDVALDAPDGGADAPALPQSDEASNTGATELALAPEAPAAIVFPTIDTSVPERPSPASEVDDEIHDGESDEGEDHDGESREGDGHDGEGREDANVETEVQQPVELPEISAELGEAVEELTDKAPNVTTNRLPSIGAEDEIADVVPVDEPEINGADALGALAWNAVPFGGADGRPLYSIVLIDTPDGAFGPADAAEIGFPVTFVVDATAPGAQDRANAYRAGGHEVMFTLSLPQDASPKDIEVAFERASSTVPVAVGVMDLVENGFGKNRILTQHIISIVAQSGHGVIGHGKGLNAIAQLAQRDGVPAALSFRVFDDQNQSAPVIRRYFDRAAFRAQQEGYVVMVGHTYADSIAAMTEWASGERAGSMALAPVSAVMQSLQ